MNKPSPNDAKQLEPGQRVVLLAGTFDPAHIGYYRAAESLCARAGVSQVWLAPFSGKSSPEHVRNMCTVLASDVTVAAGRQVATCSVGLDKGFLSPDEIRGWCQRMYPDVSFILARIDGLACREDIDVRFMDSGPSECHAMETVFLRCASVPSDLTARIAQGRDVSRQFSANVWEYVQRERLYR